MQLDRWEFKSEILNVNLAKHRSHVFSVTRSSGTEVLIGKLKMFKQEFCWTCRLIAAGYGAVK